MLKLLLRGFAARRNAKRLRRHWGVVRAVNALEEERKARSDAELRADTERFRQRLADGETLDGLLPEAFANVREASRRTLGMRHFDVQLIGGAVLHQGDIAEMATGEGKTLVATLALYLNALAGRGAHLVTMNDYLAERDAEWMRPIYEFLGLSVGVVLPGQPHVERAAAYGADISYGTNNEFGFDYLRDNMVYDADDRVQREPHFAIVDEVDSILIDEARTPLIISGASEDSSALYQRMVRLPPLLRRGEEDDEGAHYIVDEKQRQVELTEPGHRYTEDWLIRERLIDGRGSLYAAENLELLHHVLAALRAYALYRLDDAYIVSNDEVLLIDEHTGRTMPGRRLSEGLHQALEAKEGLPIQSESQTLASTTFQNYFRLYDKLAGMTGTAATEAPEFQQIYGLGVTVVPTDKPLRRVDADDLVFLSAEEKWEAVVEDIAECVERGAPVLVGTTSIEASEHVAGLLRAAGVEYQVLNAKQHRREADIVAQAGAPGAVTIATNMAGRGTDIILGGNVEAAIAKIEDCTEEQSRRMREEWRRDHQRVIEAGGLHLIGTERHESRRIDNQLRGRAGRQGDPGLARFYLSMDDNLMRIFLSDRVKNFMRGLGLGHGEVIEHRMVSNAIEKAQRRVEARNFEMRKQLLEYDDIANMQRKVVYAQRDELLHVSDIGEAIADIREELLDQALAVAAPPHTLPEQWDMEELARALRLIWNYHLPEDFRFDDSEALRRRLSETLREIYAEKRESLGAETLASVERQVMMQVLDMFWKRHLTSLEHLRQGIHLRAYAQRNPKEEYKREAFEMFQSMLDAIKREVTRLLWHLQSEQLQDAAQPMRAAAPRVDAPPPAAPPAGGGRAAALATDVEVDAKVGRNSPCPCGSGRKYKHCHGA